MARVVVVEDDATNALVAHRVLARMGGHDVTVTDDGEQVLALCDAGVDLVIMDVSLANTRVDGRAVDGTQLTRIIRERCGADAPPVLLLTAHAMRGDRARLLAASGAAGYIAKPVVDHQALVERVAALLATRAA